MLLKVWAERKGSIKLATRSTKTEREKASLGFRATFFFCFLKLYIMQPVTNLEISLSNTVKIAFAGPNQPSDPVVSVPFSVKNLN